MFKQKLSAFYQNFRYFRRVIKTYAFKKYNLLEVLILWLKRHLNRAQFLVFSGIIVGFLGGLGGILLKVIVHYIQAFTVGNLGFSEKIMAYGTLPILGIVLTTLVARYLYRSKEDIKLSNVLVDIAQNDSNIHKAEMHSRLIQSAITVGLGGSAGLETPSAITGAAIGSNFGQRYRLAYKEKTLLLAGGAAAGIAAAFNAPIAGVMFSFEMLLTGVVFSDFVPLVISALCGSLVTRFVLNDDILFSVTSREPFNYSNILYFIILGVVAGFYARYYIVTSKKVSNLLNKFPFGSMKRALLGGVILAALCVLFPALYGEGYVNINKLHDGEINFVVYQEFIDAFGRPELTIFIVLLLTTLFKSFATSASLNSGGVGGNFAPSLIAGGLMGYTFGYGLTLLGFVNVPMTNLMLVGMAGALAGVLYAPLTAIFLIAEASNGYDLLMPLMIVSVTSYLINRYFSPNNPTYDKLVQAGRIFTSKHDRNIVNQIRLRDCYDEQSIKTNVNSSLRSVDHYFRRSDKSVMAVTDEQGHFWGMILREQLGKIDENSEDKITASDIAVNPAFTVLPDEDIESVVQKFEQSDVWYLPVVDKDHRYRGFISRFRFLTKYRSLLKNYS